MERYLNDMELAQILKIPVSTVNYYRRIKGLPAISIGKHWRYLLSEVQNYFRRRNGN